ncbi:MAG: hypothetical protein OJF51_004785 [Nitrospira sp.]|nr:MAG: hypothetical protein OJF51_004785 [Nitrospira sp.]
MLLGKAENVGSDHARGDSEVSSERVILWIIKVIFPSHSTGSQM